MNFKELMIERQAILQGIEEQEAILFHRLEEEHYERVLGILKEQVKELNK